MLFYLGSLAATHISARCAQASHIQQILVRKSLSPLTLLYQLAELATPFSLISPLPWLSLTQLYPECPQSPLLTLLSFFSPSLYTSSVLRTLLSFKCSLAVTHLEFPSSDSKSVSSAQIPLLSFRSTFPESTCHPLRMYIGIFKKELVIFPPSISPFSCVILVMSPVLSVLVTQYMWLPKPSTWESSLLLYLRTCLSPPPPLPLFLSLLHYHCSTLVLISSYSSHSNSPLEESAPPV